MPHVTTYYQIQRLGFRFKVGFVRVGRDILSFKLSILSFIALYQKVCTMRTIPRALRYESNIKTLLPISTLPDS